MSVTSYILPEAGVGTLIGRAWNLVRLNFKATVLLMMVPIVLYTVVSILFSIPSGVNTFIKTPANQIGVLLVSFGAGLVLSIGAWFVTLGCSCMLSHVYFTALTRSAPVPVGESVRFVLRRWPGLMWLSAGMLFLYVVFLAVDALIGMLGFGVGMALMTRLSASLMSYLPGLLLMIFAMLAWGSLIAGTLIVLLSGQMLFCLFPIVSLASAQPAEGTWRRAVQSWRVLWHNLPKGILFGVLLLFVSIVLASAFNVIPALWSFLEMKRLGLGPQNHIHMPLHISTALNLWSSLTHLVLMPSFVGGMTLFWYDCQVRRQGLDLCLWLERLKERAAGGSGKKFGGPPEKSG